MTKKKKGKKRDIEKYTDRDKERIEWGWHAERTKRLAKKRLKEWETS